MNEISFGIICFSAIDEHTFTFANVDIISNLIKLFLIHNRTHINIILSRVTNR